MLGFTYSSENNMGVQNSNLLFSSILLVALFSISYRFFFKMKLENKVNRHTCSFTCYSFNLLDFSNRIYYFSFFLIVFSSFLSFFSIGLAHRIVYFLYILSPILIFYFLLAVLHFVSDLCDGPR
jgi:hypothetical protein